MTANMNSHRPDGRADQERREQPCTCGFLPGNQQAGNRHGHAADQEVPGTTEADQFGAANGQREAEQGDDYAQAQEKESRDASGARCSFHVERTRVREGKDAILAR
jgi:hypothetical protein